jgi:hypothetical protein
MFVFVPCVVPLKTTLQKGIDSLVKTSETFPVILVACEKDFSATKKNAENKNSK